ncbi:MAG TPA: Uma2 family endonuclease [Aggregatilineales bacterium]|nr:Uma2 family endonuclease [Aggregatilineales bacterium]
MVQQTVRLGMSMSDFIEQYNQQPFELVNGESIALSPNISGHQWIARTLYDAVNPFIREHALGELLWETPFVLTDSPDWVKGSRTPDLIFYSAQRWAEYIAAIPDWKGKPIVMVPDLVVEIVSPNDRYSDIDDKVDGYLADGVQMVWVLDPQRRKIVIHLKDHDQQIPLRENGLLTGGDLLPGLSVPVKALFA